MKKKVKLILVPHNPEKWEVGMLVIIKGQLCTLTKSWLNKQKWERKIQPVQPYFISEENFIEGQEYNDLVANFDGVNWIVFKTNKLLPDFKEVIATPEKIGLFSINNSEPSENTYLHYIKLILTKDGQCEIDMKFGYIECHNYGGKHLGKDCSCKGGDFRDVYVPEKINKKVVIYL